MVQAAETKTITATFVRNLSGWKSDAQLWKLSEPVGYDEDGGAKVADHVIVSAVEVMFSGPETYIFPATSDGDALDMLEMVGSLRGALDHEAAIARAGWEIVRALS
jgi:hypothetical protein